MAPSLLFEFLSDLYGAGILMKKVYYIFGQEY